MEVQFGRCTECGEMTDIKDPCCNASVIFEGDVLTMPEDSYRWREGTRMEQK